MPVGKSKPCRRRSVIVPYGLKTWLECLAMAVAKECPKCMRRFIAKYCQELMEYRNENPMMDIRDLVLTYQSLRENRRSLKKHYHVDGQYSQFKCFSWCTTLSSCDAHNVQAEIQRTERTDDMGQSVAIETSTASKDLISCHSEDVSKAIGLYMSQPGKENEQGPSATTSEAIPDVVVHNKAPALVPTPNLSRAPSGDLQDGNVVEKELGCQATDRLTYQQSTDISRSPSEELLSEYEQLSDGEFEIGAQHVSAIAVRYLSETMMEYEQFSEGGFGIATQKISDVSLQEITSSEERMSDESYGSPKLSPMSSSESAVRVASPLQTVEFHHLRDNKHEIDVRASAEQLDLTSSCMLYRSSYDSLSEEEESAESATILERSHSEAVLRTISLEERLNRQEERSKEETYFSGVTDETLLDDGEEDADLVVLYEAPSDECVVSSENSEISADVCGDLSPTQEGASVSVHSSFMVTKGSVVMGTTPSVRCLTLSPVSSDVKKEVCASGNNLSSIPPSAVMELPDVSGDVNIPREEDMTSQHVATEIKRHIPLRPSSESINFASSWDQARLHSSSKPRVKDLSRLSSLTRQSNRTTLNEKEGSASGFTEDHLSTMAHTESSITVLFENSDEDVDDESESLAVAESLAEYHSIPEVVIVHKAPSFEELPETDEEDLHRSESSVGRPDSLSGAQGSQSSVTSPTMSVGAENTDGTPYVVIIHKAPSEKDLPDTPFTPGVENMVGSGSALAEDVARLPLVHDKLPPKAPHQSEEKSSEAETAANPPAKTLYDEVVGDALKTSESLRSPRLGPTSSCILEAAKDSDTTTHVVIIHKASSGEGFPEVSITSNVESVGPQSSLKWVPSANESVTSSGTQSLNERDKSVSSVTTKSPRLTPQRSKGDVSRTTSSDRLSVSASGLNEDIYEVQLSVDTEKDSVGQSVKDSVGTANSAERLRDSSCISGALEISVSNSCVIFSSNDDDIAFENGSSTLHSDHYHSLTKSDTSAECCATLNERFNEMPVDDTLEMRTASLQQSSEGIQFSSISKDAEEADYSPNVVNISREKLPESGVTLGLLEKVPFAASKKTEDDTLDVHNSRIDTVFVGPSEAAEQRVAYVRTPSEDEISTDISVVIRSDSKLSPRHLSGDVSERVSSEHLQVSTSGLWSTPGMSAEDISEPTLSIQEVILDNTSGVVKCSSHIKLDREPSELTTTKESSTVTSSEKSVETSFDGTTEAKMASSQSSSERIQSNCILEAVEVAEIIPHVVIHKAPSGAELTETGSSCSLGHGSLSATDSLDVQKSVSGTSVVAPPESTEERVAYIRTPSQDEISGEVSVVIVRSPRVSPHHSIGDISKRASSEQLQVPNSGLASTPTVLVEDTTELLISHEDVSSEKTLDIAQCSSDSILEREEPCETATTRASPPPPTPSGQHIAEMVKSDKRLKSPVLSLISSCASEKSNKISVDGMLEVTLTSSQPSLESIQPPSMLKSADDSEMSPHILIIQKEPSIVENPESDMTTGVLVRIPPAASKIAQDDVKHLAYDTLDVEKSESDTAVVASPEKEQRTVYIRIPSQDEICAEVSVVSIKSPQLSPRHSSGNVSERVSTEHLQVSTSGLVSAPTVPTSAKDVSEDTFKMQANGIGSPITSSTFSEGSFHLDPSQGFSPVRSPSAILLKTKDHLKEAKISCEEMLAQDTTKILSQEKIPSPGLSPMVSEIIGVWCDNLSEEQQDETDESLEGLFLKWPRKACVSAESLDLETETDINEVAIVEEVHQQSSKTDFAENLKNTIPAATTISATALIAPSTRIPSKDSVEVMPTLSREKITFPRLSPKSSYVLQRSSPDGHQSRCLSPLSSSVRGHSPERLESPRSSPVTEFLSSVEWATQTSRSSLPIIDKATQMSRTSLLLISQASQTSRTLLAGAKQESRPSFPSVDQETQISWTLPQGIDKRTQISRTPVTSSDQGSQMSSVNLHNQGTQMIIPQEVSVTETTVDSRKLTCQSSSAGNWDDGKQSAHDISPGGFKEAEETQKDKIWTLYHLGQKNDEGLLSTQVLSEPPFNGEAYIRNFGTGAVLLSERRRERLKPLSAPIRGRLVSASAFKPGQRPSSLGPSEVVIRPPHPPSRSSSTLPDYVLVVDTETVNLDNFFNAPGTNQVQTNPLAWMSSQF
ncbi:serine-rich adhesin for platelets-like isoform X16 [Alosa sapidissima]|uniref:serine-rich adhesin for platelets-like isoform X14 n=1 Tax=Alosa sapidissima TaxID=34773 RepID=UPI001C093482|nr:serine-rich adhesin for platelets-like isoform X14 [Alosa sapidissima]XP_041913351.1 serine-rich adhesin for platelets-like isoform X16 [Alosa sapidissima]